MLYGLLDAARERSEAALREVHGRGAAGGPSQCFLRGCVESRPPSRPESFPNSNGVERGLCFGRMDDTDGGTFYIGRIGLHDDDEVRAGPY